MSRKKNISVEQSDAKTCYFVTYTDLNLDGIFRYYIKTQYQHNSQIK